MLLRFLLLWLLMTAASAVDARRFQFLLESASIIPQEQQHSPTTTTSTLVRRRRLTESDSSCQQYGEGVMMMQYMLQAMTGGEFACTCQPYKSFVRQDCQSQQAICDEHQQCATTVQVATVWKTPTILDKMTICFDKAMCLEAHYGSDGTVAACHLVWEGRTCQACSVCANSSDSMTEFTGDCRNLRGPAYVQDQCTNFLQDLDFFHVRDAPVAVVLTE